MIKIKTIWSLILCMLLVISLGASCSGNQANNASTTTTTNTTNTTASYEYEGKAPVVAEPVTLTWLGPQSGVTGADDAKAPHIIDALKQANINVEFELIDGASYVEAITPRLASGVDLPDIIKLPNLDPTMQYINSGIFIDITDLYDKYGFNLKEVYQKYPEVKAGLTTPEGKMYYVPTIAMKNTFVVDIMVNLKWLNKLGIEIPTTIDEYYSMLKAFKTEDPNGNGIADEIPLFAKNGYLQSFGSMWGLDLNRGFAVDENSKVEASYATLKYKDLLTFFNKLYKEKLLDNEFATATSDIRNSKFAKNLVGTTIDYSVHASKTLSKQFSEYDGIAPIISNIPPVKGPYGNQFYWGVDPLASVFGITKYCKEPEAAFNLFDYLLSEEGVDIITFGKEGVLYNIVDGKRVWTDLKNDVNYINTTGADAPSIPRIQNVEMVYSYYPDWHVEQDKSLIKYYKQPIGFVYSLESEIEILEAYAADLSTYWSEMFIAFITGTESLDKFDDYLKNLEALHIKELTQVYQDRYDRFIEATK